MVMRLSMGLACCAALWTAGAFGADDEPGDAQEDKPSASSPAEKDPSETDDEPDKRVTAPGATNLDAEVGEIADAIGQLLKKYELDSIAVGQFTGPAQTASSSGPAIANSLIQ